MQISFYLLQSLTYPFSPLALALMNGTGMNDFSAIAIVAIPILLLAVVLLWTRRRRALLAMALQASCCVVPGFGPIWARNRQKPTVCFVQDQGHALAWPFGL